MAKGPTGLYDWNRFAPGLTTNLPLTQLVEGQAQSLLNVDLRHDSVKARGGWTSAGTTALNLTAAPQQFGTTVPTYTVAAGIGYLDITTGTDYVSAGGGVWNAAFTLSPFTTGTGPPPGSPSVNQGYFNTATNVVYICTVAGSFNSVQQAYPQGAQVGTLVSDVYNPGNSVAAVRSAGVLAVAGNNLYNLPGSFPSAPNLLSSTLNTNGSPVLPLLTQFAEINGAVYLAVSDSSLSNQKLQKWDGASLTTISAAPLCTGVVEFNNSLWAMNGGNPTAVPNRLIWSGVMGQSGVDTWPADNFLDLTPADGDIIFGHGRLHNALVIFKQHSVWRLTGQQPDDASLSTGTLQLIPLGISTGCRAPNSIASKDDLIVWLSRDGVFSYDGVHIRELTTAIRPFFQTVTAADEQQARGAWINHHQYVLTVNSQTNGRVALVITLGAVPSISMWKFDNTTPSGMFSLATTPGPGQVAVEDAEASFLFGTTDGFVAVYSDTTPTDNGAAVPWNYTTGLLAIGPSEAVKITDAVWVRGPTGADAFSLTFAGKSANTKTGTPTAVNPLAETRLVVPMTGRNLTAELSGTASSIPRTEVDQVQIHYRTQIR